MELQLEHFPNRNECTKIKLFCLYQSIARNSSKRVYPIKTTHQETVMFFLTLQEKTI